MSNGTPNKPNAAQRKLMGSYASGTTTADTPRTDITLVGGDASASGCGSLSPRSKTTTHISTSPMSSPRSQDDGFDVEAQTQAQGRAGPANVVHVDRMVSVDSEKS